MEQAVGTRIAALRKRMAERGMDAYLIPTADFHGSEYVDCLLYTSDAADD